MINRIKLIKHIACGLPNFDYLRARILVKWERPP
ncbi:MAG: hypothetical protein ACE5K4_11075 [Candidatus Hydrothermarchaeota archaeon]